jgi:hypothetical protein
MNANIKIFLLCPVPEDQKPINEYINIKENTLFNWVTFSSKKYFEKIRNLFLIFFTSSFLFLQLFFNNFTDIFYLVFLNFLITICFFTFFLFIIRIRWLEIKNKFNSTRLFYEEASWYDGQIWEKPFELIKNDKLISSQKLEPIIQRINNLIFFFFFLSFIFFLIFKILY